MDELAEKHFELPDPKRSGGSIVWKLSSRGLEWEGGQSRAAWMPFACMRRITLGSVNVLGGWRMRIAGPPGSLLVGASHYKTPQMPSMVERFSELASVIIREAARRGCPPKLRLNDKHFTPEILWGNLGRLVLEPDALLSRLEVSPK